MVFTRTLPLHSLKEDEDISSEHGHKRAAASTPWSPKASPRSPSARSFSSPRSPVGSGRPASGLQKSPHSLPPPNWGSPDARPFSAPGRPLAPSAQRSPSATGSAAKEKETKLTTSEKKMYLAQMAEVQAHLGALAGIATLEPSPSKRMSFSSSIRRREEHNAAANVVPADGGPTPAQVASMQQRLSVKFGEDAAAFLLHEIDVSPPQKLLYYLVVLQLRTLPQKLPQTLGEAYTNVFTQHWARAKPETQALLLQLMSVLVAAQEPLPTVLLRGMGLGDALPLLPAWGTLFQDKEGRATFVDPSLPAWLRDAKASKKFHADERAGHEALGDYLYGIVATQGPRALNSYGLRFVAVHLVRTETPHALECLDWLVTNAELLELLFASRHDAAFYIHLSRVEPKSDAAREVLRWMRHNTKPLRAHPRAVGQLAQAAPTSALMAKLSKRMLEPEPPPPPKNAPKAAPPPVTPSPQSFSGGLPLVPQTPGCNTAPPSTPATTTAASSAAARSKMQAQLHGRSPLAPQTPGQGGFGYGMPASPRGQSGGGAHQLQQLQGSGSMGASTSGASQPLPLRAPRPPLMQATLQNAPQNWPVQLVTLDTHAGAATSIAFSPNGHFMAAAGNDGSVTMWDPACGDSEQPVKLGGHTGAVRSLDFSPDGKCLATASNDGRVVLWDTSSHTEVRALGEEAEPTPKGGKSNGHSSSDGHSPPGSPKLGAPAASSPGSVATASTSLGASASGRDLGGPVSYVRYSPDGHMIATVYADGGVAVWDASNGKILHAIDAKRPAVRFCSFSPDGQDLALARSNGTLGLWKLAITSKPHVQVLRAHGAEAVRCVQFSPSGLMLASASESDPVIKLWDFVSGEERAALAGHEAPVRFLAYSPSGLTLASASEDKTVRLWDTLKAQQHNAPAWAVLSGHSFSVNACAFSHSGHMLASASNDGIVRLFDLDAARQPGLGLSRQRPQPSPPAISSMTFSPHGSWLATGMVDGSIWLWDAMIGRCTGKLEGYHPKMVGCVVYSPNSKYLGSASEDGAICVWSASDAGPPGAGAGAAGRSQSTARAGRLQARMRNPHGWDTLSCTITFSADGALLASAHDNGLVCVWRSSTGERLHVLQAHSRLAYAVAFSRDGAVLASAADTGAVCFWNPHTGERIEPHLASPPGGNSTAGSRRGSMTAGGVASGSRNPSGGSASAGHRSGSGGGAAPSPASRHHATTTIREVSEGDEEAEEGMSTASSSPSPHPTGSPATRPSPDAREGHTASYVKPVGIELELKRLRARQKRAEMERRSELKRQTSQQSPRQQQQVSPRSRLANSTAANRSSYSGLPYAASEGEATDEELLSDDDQAMENEQSLLEEEGDEGLGASGASELCVTPPPLQGHTDFVYAVVFSPDSKRLASLSRDGFLCIWDAVRCAPIARVPHGHNTSKRARAKLEYGRTGQLVVSSMDEDQVVKLWHADSGVCLASLDRVRLIVGAWAVVSLTPYAPFITHLPDTPEQCERLSEAQEERARLQAAMFHHGQAGAAQPRLSPGDAALLGPHVHLWTHMPSIHQVCLRQDSLVLTKDDEIQFYKLTHGSGS